jgi:hypothetical protein
MLKFPVDFGNLLIGTKGTRLLRECESKGDPTGVSEGTEKVLKKRKRSEKHTIYRSIGPFDIYI